MSSKKYKFKNEKKIKIENTENEKKFNEIKITRRNLENNTHEVLEDMKLKSITSWRKSKSKFLKSLIFNVFTLGIIHLISLYYPKLYIKLYCNPWSPKECDFFLVENIYGQFTLCTKIYKKNKNKDHTNYNYDFPQDGLIIQSNIKKQKEFYYTRNLTYSFVYKSMTYEYNEITEDINPVYLDLSRLTNKEIKYIFGDGLTTEKRVNLFRERYGKNEYYININLLFLYFKKVELPSLIIVLIIGAFEFSLKDYISFIFKYIIVFGIFFCEFLISKNITSNIKLKDNSIDGEINDIKVKRKYLFDENNNNQFYAKISNKDLLPGDIIFLKSEDIVPCDCLILEGECIANESNSTGNIDIFKKISLENNDKIFNYKLSKVNTLYHGMEIINSFSKTSKGYISALCINTGPNTFKANQYSNILDLSDRKKEYKEVYEYFGNERKYVYISIIFVYIFSLLLGGSYILIFKLRFEFINTYYFVFSILIRTLCKSCMPMYFITNSIIILLSVNRLKNNKILCFDKSRLLKSGSIDTIFFSKTGTLCYNNFEINSYHPAYANPNKPGLINIRNYPESQCSEINYILERYYQDYYYRKQTNTNYNNYNSFISNHRFSLLEVSNSYDKNKAFSWEYIALFVECLLSCNNLEKLGTKIFGNIIETTIFNDMKWDIKLNNFDEEKEIENNELKNFDSGFSNKKLKNYLINQFNIIQKRRNDIFPKNYYKITESLLYLDKKAKFQENASTLDTNCIYEQTRKLEFNDLVEDESNSSNVNNPIFDDVNKSHIDSYILRIYKRFISEGSFNSSSIVYNFMKKELRFMVKGIPEDILDKCELITIPDNFEEIISSYRKNGLIILVCASKILNIEDYSDSNTIDYYMNDLTFCGFITLKNKIRSETKSAIQELKRFNCNLIITSGDNVNNSLSVGFDSGILENKNVFVFDKDDEVNKISIRKIYNVKMNQEEIEDNDINSSYDKHISKMSHKKSINSKLKPELKYNYSFVRSSKSRKEVYKKNESLIGNQSKESVDLINLQHPKLNFENPNKYNNKNPYKRNMRKFFKSSKALFDKNFQKSLERENLLNNKSLINSNSSEINRRNENENENENESKKEKFVRLKSRLSSIGISNLNTKSQNIINEVKNKIMTKQNKGMEENGSITKRAALNLDMKNKFLKYFQKFYYYPSIFRDNEELKDKNCIFCVSGKLFSHLYKNKDIKEYKFLLERIHNNCKIFFQMSSIDKSLTIDYFREFENSCICKIGECQSDFDSIMTSNVGINLRSPKNLNTILCHFYTSDSSILSIKKIILEGRISYENSYLLRISSIFCTLIINSYIITCFIRHIDVIIGQLNLLEMGFLILSVTGFTGNPDINIEPEPLIRIKKLFNLHYIIQIAGLLILKLIIIYEAIQFYYTNRLLDPSYVDKIFVTYYFILCIELIFSTSFTINYISFYRKNILSNTFFMFFIILLMAYFIMLITLNSSNIRFDIFNLSYFEFFEYIIDSIDDRNRLKFFVICLCDFIMAFIFSRVTYLIFNQLARKKLSEEKI